MEQNNVNKAYEKLVEYYKNIESTSNHTSLIQTEGGELKYLAELREKQEQLNTEYWIAGVALSICVGIIVGAITHQLTRLVELLEAKSNSSSEGPL